MTAVDLGGADLVTCTTLSFGDVKPGSLVGELIVYSKVILRYTSSGLLLSVLAQNIARRSLMRCGWNC
jgi:hypothetical protein